MKNSMRNDEKCEKSFERIERFLEGKFVRS
jgi:hypothetical protein